MKRLPKGQKAQIMGTQMFQTMYTTDQMREYAKKAVEAEREACAKVCDDAAELLNRLTNYAGADEANACAAAIRAGGNT
jgi:hypothetical protein